MNLQENIERIKEVMVLNESLIPIEIRRRANRESLEKYIQESEIENLNPCDDFFDEHDYAYGVIAYALILFFDDIDENMSKHKNYKDILKYLTNLCFDLFGQKIRDIYLETCSEADKNSGERQEQKESEITERCWKGYTKKGMKTMFGKKYPNCVKKTK